MLSNTDDPNQLVIFGTSGHRGSPLCGTFTEAHILAITQAICDYRRKHGTDGPLYGKRHACAVGAGSADRARAYWRRTMWRPSSSQTMA